MNQKGNHPMATKNPIKVKSTTRHRINELPFPNAAIGIETINSNIVHKRICPANVGIPKACASLSGHSNRLTSVWPSSAFTGLIRVSMISKKMGRREKVDRFRGIFPPLAYCGFYDVDDY